MRVGIGYDAHRLVEGRELMLGGVRIAHEKGLLGHSDADVLLHAVCDALLGAAGLGDIGGHFPDSDPVYKDAASIGLLEAVRAKLAAAGFRCVNVDAVIVAQRPRLAPYLEDMRTSVAAALQIEPGAVNVKATTTEGMGFEGTGEGISAQAVALIE